VQDKFFSLIFGMFLLGQSRLLISTILLVRSSPFFCPVYDSDNFTIVGFILIILLCFFLGDVWEIVSKNRIFWSSVKWVFSSFWISLNLLRYSWCVGSVGFFFSQRCFQVLSVLFDWCNIWQFGIYLIIFVVVVKFIFGFFIHLATCGSHKSMCLGFVWCFWIFCVL